MTLHGKHFATIYEKVFVPFSVAFQDIDEVSCEPNLAEKKHHLGMSCVFDHFQNDIKISRTVFVSQIDLQDNFTVELIEALEDPHYVVHRRKWTSHADTKSQMDYVCNQIQHFFHKDIKVKEFPTAEQVNHLKSLRGWSGGDRAELYFDSDEFGESWKIRLVDPDTKQPYVEHLPADISGVMVQTLHTTYNRGFLRGEISAVNRMAERIAAEQARYVVEASHIRRSDINDRLGDFIHTGSLAAIGKIS
jgi:hypothetical protein